MGENSMSFPINPVDGQIHNLEYIYNSTVGIWEKFSNKHIPSFRAHTEVAVSLGDSNNYEKLAGDQGHVRPTGVGSWSGNTYTAPYDAYYEFIANATFTTGGGTDDTIYWSLLRDTNGSEIKYFYAALNPNEFTNAGSEMISSIGGIIPLNAGDTVCVYVENIMTDTPVNVADFAVSGHLVQLR